MLLKRAIHSTSDGKRIPSSATTHAIEWDTWTGVLGDEVAGMWPKYSQVNDINATHASYQHRTIVTGDDFGLVKLFRFPCTTKGKFHLGVLCAVCNLLSDHSVSATVLLLHRCQVSQVRWSCSSCDECALPVR